MIVACGSVGEAQEVEREESNRDDMVEHAQDAVAARDAVIAGEIDGVKAAAARLKARLPMMHLPQGTAPHETAFVIAVQALEAPRDIHVAAEAVGNLALACGGCHAAVHAQVDLDPVPAAPPVDGSVKSAMVAHRLGAVQMWNGLVQPDTAQVVAGAEVLSSSVLAPTGTPVGSKVSALATELEVRVHDLASSAARTESAEQRARSYGQLLETCASCHALLHGGPGNAVDEPRTP
jgi:cytochrome c553